LIATGAFAFGSLQAACSALLGGGISALVSLYFASKVFSVRIGRPPPKSPGLFIVGEIVKLLLTVTLLSGALTLA
jgi:ATP synthase protein I